MQKILNRAIIIGLGGTGQRILLEMKLKFLRDFGTIPPLIKFIAIDTDGAEDPRSITHFVKGEGRKKISTRFEPDEYLHISSSKMETYIEQPHITRWLPEEYKNKIQNCAQGAKQQRFLGRACFYQNITSIRNMIYDARGKVTSPNSVRGDNYTIGNVNKIDYYVVFSSAGGTGSGTFIDFAALLRLDPSFDDERNSIHGFMIGPEIYSGLKNSHNIRPNTYGAFMDLDYLMTPEKYNDKNNSFKFAFTPAESAKPSQMKAPLYNNFYVFENASSQISLTRIAELEKLVSNSIYCLVSSAARCAKSVIDNKRDFKITINNKFSTYSGIGFSQLNFDKEYVYNYLVLNYKRKFLDSFLVDNTRIVKDLDKEIEEFLLKEKIKEDGNNDFLINELFNIELNSTDKNSYIFNPEKSEKKDNWSEILQSLFETKKNIVEEFSKNEINSRCEKIIKNTLSALRSKFLEYLNLNGGTNVTKDFFNKIKGRILNMKQELEIEIKSHKIELEDLNKESVVKALEYLTTAEQSWKAVFNSNQIDQEKTNYIDSANNILKLNIELKRKSKAIEIYNQITQEIGDYERKLDLFESNLKMLLNRWGVELSSKKQEITSSKPNGVIIPLHLHYLKSYEIKKDSLEKVEKIINNNIKFDEYFAIEKPTTISEDSLTGKIEKSIENEFKNELDSNLNFSAVDILKKIQSIDPSLHSNIVKTFGMFSSPFWDINKQFDPSDEEHIPKELFLISTSQMLKIDDDKEVAEIESDETILIKHLGNAVIQNKVGYYTGYDDSTIEILRINGSAPLFAINKTIHWYMDYKKSNSQHEHHIDLVMMKKLDVINPEYVRDANETLKPWAIANAVGFCKKMMESQSYKDKFDEEFHGIVLSFPFIIIESKKYKMKTINLNMVKYKSPDGYTTLFDPPTRASNRAECFKYFSDKVELCSFILDKFEKLTKDSQNQNSFYKLFIDYIIFHLQPNNIGKQQGSLDDNESELLMKEVKIIHEIIGVDLNIQSYKYSSDLDKAIRKYKDENIISNSAEEMKDYIYSFN